MNQFFSLFLVFFLFFIFSFFLFVSFVPAFAQTDLSGTLQYDLSGIPYDYATTEAENNLLGSRYVHPPAVLEPTSTVLDLQNRINYLNDLVSKYAERADSCSR